MLAVKSMSVIMVGALGLVAMTLSLAQEPAGGIDAKIKELQQQKLKLLEQRLQEAQALQQNTRAEPDIVLNDELDVLKYKLELTSDKQQRIALLNDMLKNRQASEEYMENLHSSGRMTAKDDHFLPSLQRIDIEIMLAKETANP